MSSGMHDGNACNAVKYKQITACFEICWNMPWLNLTACIFSRLTPIRFKSCAKYCWKCRRILLGTSVLLFPSLLALFKIPN